VGVREEKEAQLGLWRGFNLTAVPRNRGKSGWGGMRSSCLERGKGGETVLHDEGRRFPAHGSNTSITGNCPVAEEVSSGLLRASRTATEKALTVYRFTQVRQQAEDVLDGQNGSATTARLGPEVQARVATPPKKDRRPGHRGRKICLHAGDFVGGSMAGRKVNLENFQRAP